MTAPAKNKPPIPRQQALNTAIEHLRKYPDRWFSPPDIGFIIHGYGRHRRDSRTAREILQGLAGQGLARSRPDPENPRATRYQWAGG